MHITVLFRAVVLCSFYETSNRFEPCNIQLEPECILQVQFLHCVYKIMLPITAAQHKIMLTHWQWCVCTHLMQLRKISMQVNEVLLKGQRGYMY